MAEFLYFLSKWAVSLEDSCNIGAKNIDLQINATSLIWNAKNCQSNDKQYTENNYNSVNVLL